MRWFVSTVLVSLVTGVLAVLAPVVTHSPAAVSATVPVGKQQCRRLDPNLVNGVCLRYRTRGGASAYTWIGTYRAANGRVFFCIDYLYDSRLPSRARTFSTKGLHNQMGQRVGDPEVAALNYLISRWAGRGSTGSDTQDAAIALIVREVMGDGIRGDGLVVYPRGLRVGEAVRPPRGGLDRRVLDAARHMWDAASRYYGPYRLKMVTTQKQLRLGRKRIYRTSVWSAAGKRVPGVRMRFRCRGPINCPSPIRSKSTPVRVAVKPRRTGRFRIEAIATGPAADGALYVDESWHGHQGDRARPAGIQRGWIARRNTTRAVVADRATITRGRPSVTTVTSDALALPGAEIHDVVTVTGLPRGYRATAISRLFGPFDQPPGADDCTSDRLVSEVGFEVTGDGVYRSPDVSLSRVGYYVWTQTLPGDRHTVATTTACGIVEETTQVEKLTPQVTTVASAQRAHVGDRIHDTVEVTGIAHHPVLISWVLRGPLLPRNGGCSGLSWSRARVVDQGTLAAAGSGRYRTPATRVTVSGCYTYSEEIAETEVTYPAASPPGVPAETVLVRSTPSLSTVASTQRATTGDRVHDAVRVQGFTSNDSGWVQWRLHGPMAPRNGSCRGLAWSRAPIADEGVFAVPGNGFYRSGTTNIGSPGCYTYSESMAATATTEAAKSSPGLSLETFLATRPAVPGPPAIPSGDAGSREAPDPDPRFLRRRYVAPRELVTARPGSTLRIPSVGIAAPVDTVGLDGPVMAIPNDPSHVGWLSRSARPGDVVGSSVLSGHVSDRRDRPGAFARLGRVRVGDRVQWSVGGRTHTYRVTRRGSYPRSSRLPASLFRTSGTPVLQLVTCRDRRRTPGGGFHYAANLVLTAVPVR